ncbi:hypothetical protein [Adhaeribacter rhizoryzae]|uniref:Uncharacterized protein n=1 Tax=Adhaeribacter rhizoryzae TaxID=2607907 RepID=A0A5M6DTH7_9BACT|nr:hypothetical protein [Adhaeribacter rhizoryzae]KAA5549576.1 hypothetical protein F0145_03050 [Adhaeribacter rhizoryzae]
MKKILLFLFLLPLYALAQEDEKPLPEADLIIVETKGELVMVLKELALVMQEKGYFIEDYNKELLNIIATKRTTSWHSLEIKVNAYIREKENGNLNLYFFGAYNTKNGEEQYQGSANFNNNLLRRNERIAFEEINKLAKAFPGSSVIYGKL